MQDKPMFKTAKVPLTNLAGARNFPLPPMPKKAPEPPVAAAQATASSQGSESTEPQGAPLHVVSAAAAPLAPVVPPLTPQHYPLGQAFGLPDIPAQYLIEGNAPGHPFAPKASEDYEFKRADLRDLMAFWEDGLTALKIEGDPATGKSSLVIEFHARLHWPLYMLSASQETEARHIFGQLLPDTHGRLRWVDGPALRAAREGTSFLVDEGNLLDPNIASSLNLLSEGNPYDIAETGERVIPKKGFRLFWTENPVDSRLLVAGRMQQDVASDDRFMILKTDYMPADQEIRIVKAALVRQGQPEAQAQLVASQVVGIANKTRESYRNGEAAIDHPMSTRAAIRWARLICRFRGIKPQEGGPVIYALHRATRMSRSMAAAVEGFTRAALGTQP